MATRKTKRKTTTQGPKIRPPIVKIINELKSWLPNYDHGAGSYPDMLLRILASLPGGDELTDVGFEPFDSIGWHEADQLGRVLEAIQDKQDVEDIARELLSENQEELEEQVGSPIARESRVSVGDRVAAGRQGTEDYDTGKVLSIHGRMATVGWDSGVRTDIDVDELRPTTERHSDGQRLEASRRRGLSPHAALSDDGRTYEIKGASDTLDIYQVGSGPHSSWAVDNGNGNELGSGMSKRDAINMAMRYAGDGASIQRRGR